MEHVELKSQNDKVLPKGIMISGLLMKSALILTNSLQ